MTDISEYLPTTFKDVDSPPVYGCAVPHHLRVPLMVKRMQDRLWENYNQPQVVVLHPSLYAALENLLNKRIKPVL